MSNFYGYLDKIIELRKVIDETKNELNSKENKFDADALDLKSTIRQSQVMIERIKNIEIAVPLTEIISNISKLWQVREDTIEISHFTNCSVPIEEDLMQEIQDKQSMNKAYLHFTLSQNEALNSRNELTFRTKLDFDAIQADGKTLAEHTKPMVLNVNDSTYLDLAIDNYSNMTPRFQVRDLIYEKNGHILIKDALARAVIDAYNESSNQDIHTK